MSTITVRLDKKLDSELRKLAKKTGRPKSELIREALRRQIAIARFEDLRQTVAPFAEARGWLTDEDVFRAVS
jgi:predicted transcriptional regulator